MDSSAPSQLLAAPTRKLGIGKGEPFRLPRAARPKTGPETRRGPKRVEPFRAEALRGAGTAIGGGGRATWRPGAFVSWMSCIGEDGEVIIDF